MGMKNARLFSNINRLWKLLWMAFFVYVTTILDIVQKIPFIPISIVDFQATYYKWQGCCFKSKRVPGTFCEINKKLLFFHHSILLFLIMADIIGIRNNYFSTRPPIPPHAEVWKSIVFPNWCVWGYWRQC